MKNLPLIIILLLIALALGFIIGQNVKPIERLKIVKEQVVDTVYKSKVIEVPVEKKVTTVDTVYVDKADTLDVIEEVVPDSVLLAEEIEIDEDSLQIKKDENIKSESLPLIVLKEQAFDTLLGKLLDVEQVKQKQLAVEYWESPVNYKGYKLSKSKLIVYGINPLMASKIYKNESIYYFFANNVFYELIETSNFKPLKTIPKPNLIND